MKKLTLYLLLGAMLAALSGCGGSEVPAQTPTESTPPPTVETATPAAAAEPVTELMIEETIPCVRIIDGKWYGAEIRLFPQLGECQILTNPNREPVILYSGSYTEENGLYTVDAGDEILRFRMEEGNAFTLEQGSLSACCERVYNPGTDSYDDFEGEEVFLFEPGMKLNDGYYAQQIHLRDGLYVLTAEEAGYGEEVLLDLDLTERTFALHCFDGSVIRGPLEFQVNYGQCMVVCRWEGGAVAFSVYNRDMETQLYDASSGLSGFVPDALLFYPHPAGSHRYSFVHVPERNDALVANPDIVPLDSCKTLAKERYHFQMPAPENPDYTCGISIICDRITDSWTISARYGTKVEGVENPDGTITLTLDDRVWNFHRESAGLVFDGGSPLLAVNPESTPQLEAEVQPGTYFAPDSFGFHYIYDTVYIVPNGTDDYSNALWIDWENQRVLFKGKTSLVMEGPFIRNDLGLRCHFGLYGADIYPSGHQLELTLFSELSFWGEPKVYELIPVHNTPELEEKGQFIIQPPEEATVPQDSVLIYEDFSILAMDNECMCIGTLILNHPEGRFYFNDDYCAFHAEGSFSEADGILTLRHDSGRTTTLRRTEKNLVVESGEPLYMAGLPMTDFEELTVELEPGMRLPLYEQSRLYSGTYTYTCENGEATVTFDTENTVFSLTDAWGNTYEGNYTVDFKFVNCNGGGRQFQFIPYSDRVRLNQRDIDKVVPVGEDFLYFDFAG